MIMQSAEFLKLSVTRQVSIFLSSMYTGPAMLQDHTKMKRKHKNQNSTQ